VNSKQGRAIVREYAAELGVPELGEKFIKDGEEGINVPEETGELFWTENFADDDQVRDAFFEDYFMSSDVVQEASRS
jgi:hypothetical protein